MVAPLVKLAQSWDMENLGLRDLVLAASLILIFPRPLHFLKEIRNPNLDGSRPGVRPATFALLPQEALHQLTAFWPAASLNTATSVESIPISSAASKPKRYYSR